MSIETTATSDVVGLTKVAPVSRRGFMSAAAAVAAGYTLAAGPVRAEVIKTDTSGLQAGDAKIKVGSEEMPAYFARPAGNTKAPVIIVAMEIFGLHEYIKDVTRRLAKLGAFAVAPDYYFRKGVDLTKVTDIKDLLPVVNAKPDAELLSDLDATVAWAGSQGGDTTKLGIIGFCRGGRNVWEYAAHSGTLKAGVAYYGQQVPADQVPAIQAALLLQYAGNDERIDAGIPAYEAALKANGKRYTIYIYEGAQHAFNNDTGAARYNKAAADLAWGRTIAFFKQELGTRQPA